MQLLHGRSGVAVDDGANDDEPGLMVAAVRLPTAPVHPLDRLGFRMWERVLAARRTSVAVPRPLHPSLFSAVQRGPTNY